MGLGINYVVRANHLVSLITSPTTDPRYFTFFYSQVCKPLSVNGIMSSSPGDVPSPTLYLAIYECES